MMQLFRTYGVYGLQMYSDWALIVLRLVVAAVLLMHGVPKIKNLRQTAANFSAMGFRPGIFWGTIAAFVEFFGGLGILVGFLVPVFAALFAIQMSVAMIWKIRRGQGFVGGYEFDAVLLSAALVLVTFGGGNASLDAYTATF